MPFQGEVMRLMYPDGIQGGKPPEQDLLSQLPSSSQIATKLVEQFRGTKWWGDKKVQAMIGSIPYLNVVNYKRVQNVNGDSIQSALESVSGMSGDHASLSSALLSFPKDAIIMMMFNADVHAFIESKGTTELKKRNVQLHKTTITEFKNAAHANIELLRKMEQDGQGEDVTLAVLFVRQVKKVKKILENSTGVK